MSLYGPCVARCGTLLSETPPLQHLLNTLSCDCLLVVARCARQQSFLCHRAHASLCLPPARHCSTKPPWHVFLEAAPPLVQARRDIRRIIQGFVREQASQPAQLPAVQAGGSKEVSNVMRLCAESRDEQVGS